MRGLTPAIEQVLVAAAADRGFADELAVDRAAAVARRGHRLSATELAVLAAVPAEELTATIASLRLKEVKRRLGLPDRPATGEAPSGPPSDAPGPGPVADEDWERRAVVGGCRPDLPSGPVTIVEERPGLLARLWSRIRR